MSLCLTCSSSIPGVLEAYHTPCCDKPICRSCLYRNPRLREYDPCLRCGDLTTDEGVRRVRRGRQIAREDRERAENVFEIGDEDEEGEEPDKGAPPAYEENGMGDRSGGEGQVPGDREGSSGPQGANGSSASSTRSGRSGRSGESPRRGEEGANGQHDEQPSKSAVADDLQVVEVRHPVSRNDTLLSIARKYAADPHDLLTLNSLPPSTLSTQPHLLRTRKTLLISRRTVPKSTQESSTLFSTDTDIDDSGSMLSDEETQARLKRERQRALKRFQLLTKTNEPGVGETYLALSEMDETSLDLLSGLEIDGEGADGAGAEKAKRALPEAGNREQRALDAFYEDEMWERANGGTKGMGNSKDGQKKGWGLGRGRAAGGSKDMGQGGWKSVGDGKAMGIKI